MSVRWKRSLHFFKTYVCVVTVWFFFTGECAVLDKYTYNLDFVKCYASSDCPPDAYLPSESFKCKLLCVVIILGEILFIIVRLGQFIYSVQQNRNGVIIFLNFVGNCLNICLFFGYFKEWNFFNLITTLYSHVICFSRSSVL